MRLPWSTPETSLTAFDRIYHLLSDQEKADLEEVKKNLPEDEDDAVLLLEKLLKGKQHLLDAYCRELEAISNEGIDHVSSIIKVNPMDDLVSAIAQRAENLSFVDKLELIKLLVEQVQEDYQECDEDEDGEYEEEAEEDEE